MPRLRVALGHDDCAVAETELHAVVADAQANAETERVAEPVCRLSYVRLGELRNDRRRGDGAVRDRHLPGLPALTSWSTHVLPSGSAKSANDA